MGMDTSWKRASRPMEKVAEVTVPDTDAFATAPMLPTPKMLTERPGICGAHAEGRSR